MNGPVSSQSSVGSSAWWCRSGLKRTKGFLKFQGVDVSGLAYGRNAPLYIYSSERIQRNISRLSEAFDSAHPRTRLFYAMKSNRNPDVLKMIAGLGSVGIDACSPGEVELALKCGFRDSQISYTATGMSRSEWEQVLQYKGVIVNIDSVGDINKIAEIQAGRSIGIRVNSGVSIGYRQNPKLMYTQRDLFSKFGIEIDRLPEVVEFAKSRGLKVKGIHSHCGCGYLTEQLPAYQSMLKKLHAVLLDFPDLEYLNLGGGLGIPLLPNDLDWDLDQWRKLLADSFAGWKGELFLEPGDYIVKDAGILVTQVTNVEEKCGKRVVWVNAGFNIHPEPVFYDLPLYPVPVQERSGEKETVTIVGNINEGHDIWFSDISLHRLEEGDYLAFMNAGGYGASMSSNHCCRGTFHEQLI